MWGKVWRLRTHTKRLKLMHMRGCNTARLSPLAACNPHSPAKSVHELRTPHEGELLPRKRCPETNARFFQSFRASFVPPSESTTTRPPPSKRLGSSTEVHRQNAPNESAGVLTVCSQKVSSCVGPLASGPFPPFRTGSVHFPPCSHFGSSHLGSMPFLNRCRSAPTMRLLGCTTLLNRLHNRGCSSKTRLAYGQAF